VECRFLFGFAAVFIWTGTLPGAQQAQYKRNGPALLSDPAVTTGAVRIHSKGTVCTTKWGKDARHVTPAMKAVAAAATKAATTRTPRRTTTTATASTPNPLPAAEVNEINPSIEPARPAV
jgi:hypothetical protein